MLALNNLQLVLVDILKVNGGWMTPDEIARALGDDRLPLKIMRVLDWLVDNGLLLKDVTGCVRYRHSEVMAEREKWQVTLSRKSPHRKDTHL